MAFSFHILKISEFLCRYLSHMLDATAVIMQAVRPLGLEIIRHIHNVYTLLVYFRAVQAVHKSTRMHTSQIGGAQRSLMSLSAERACNIDDLKEDLIRRSTVEMAYLYQRGLL